MLLFFSVSVHKKITFEFFGNRYMPFKQMNSVCVEHGLNSYETGSSSRAAAYISSLIWHSVIHSFWIYLYDVVCESFVAYLYNVSDGDPIIIHCLHNVELICKFLIVLMSFFIPTMFFFQFLLILFAQIHSSCPPSLWP